MRQTASFWAVTFAGVAIILAGLVACSSVPTDPITLDGGTVAAFDLGDDDELIKKGQDFNSTGGCYWTSPSNTYWCGDFDIGWNTADRMCYMSDWTYSFDQGQQLHRFTCNQGMA